MNYMPQITNPAKIKQDKPSKLADLTACIVMTVMFVSTAMCIVLGAAQVLEMIVWRF